MKANKNTYYRVIQEFVSYKWNDVDYHETNSQYNFTSHERFKAYNTNLKAYKANSKNPIRVINRSEKNT